MVVNPSSTSGWGASVVNSTGLGTVSVTTQVPAASPTIQSLALDDVPSPTSLSVDYSLANAGSGSTLSFFANASTGSYNGQLLSSVTNPSSGAGSSDVDIADLGNGVWHIYGLINNDEAPPSELYAAGTLKISDDILTLTEASGAKTVSTFDIAGAKYASTVAVYSTAGKLGSEDFYTASGSLYLAYASSGVSVATVESDQSALDAISGGYVVADSESHVAADLSGLEADAKHILSIKFTNASPPTLSLTTAQATSDAGALAKIASPYILEVANANSSTTISGHGSGLTITDVPSSDTITGGGSGETFVFGSDFGAAKVLDFHSYATGTNHDTIELSQKDFGSISALTGDAKVSAANVVISAGNDRLTLADMTLAQFNAAIANNDFKLM